MAEQFRDRGDIHPCLHQLGSKMMTESMGGELPVAEASPAKKLLEETPEGGRRHGLARVIRNQCSVYCRRPTNVFSKQWLEAIMEWDDALSPAFTFDPQRAEIGGNIADIQAQQFRATETTISKQADYHALPKSLTSSHETVGLAASELANNVV